MTSDFDRTLIIGRVFVTETRHPDGHSSRAASGAALETALGLARLSGAVELLTNIAPDRDGMQIVYTAIGNDVTIRPVSFTAEKTPRLVVDEGCISDVKHSGSLWETPTLRQLASSEHLHIATLSALTGPESQPVWEFVKRAHRLAHRVTFDVGLDDDSDCSNAELVDAFEAAAALSSLLHVRREVLNTLYPDLDFFSAVDHVVSCGAKLVVVTDSSADLLVQAGRKRVHGRRSAALMPDSHTRGRAMASMISSSKFFDETKPRKRDLAELRDQFWNALGMQNAERMHAQVALST